jgi:type I restriction enzyme S subunit
MPFGKSLISRKNREGVKAGLNFNDIRGFGLFIPSLELQNKFATIVEKVEIIKSQYQQNLTELENLYCSLSQKAFKGELDLSRIPLPNTMEGTIIEPVVEVKTEIEQAEYSIPKPETRQTLLRKLFDAFTLEKKEKTFLLDDFWQYAETNSQEYMDEDSPALGLPDYEQAKQWLFDLIESGQIEQQFIDKSKQIKLKVKG